METWQFKMLTLSNLSVYPVVGIRQGATGRCFHHESVGCFLFCPNLECCWLLLLPCSPCCLLGGCIHDCRLLLCIIGRLLVRKAVVVPGVVVVAIVPVICCIVSVVILLLDLVNWNPAVSNKIPCTIAFVAQWRFSF